MKTWIKGGAIALIATAMTVSLAFSDDQDKTRDRLKDQKKDGSCQMILTDGQGMLLAADQLRTKDQKKDGSCQDGAIRAHGNLLAKDQLRTRTKDQLKDGSCQDGAIRAHGNLIAADQLRTKDQKKDGSCQDGAIRANITDHLFAASQNQNTTRSQNRNQKRLKKNTSDDGVES